VIGRNLSQYRIEAKLGQGGMGEVWRASDSRLGRHVALKILPEAFARDPERMARFQREAQLLASLNHPHIGAIYGLEELDGMRALVLELIEGPTLAERIAERPLPIEEALPIAHQIAQALESAHEAGVVHRDLKPENIKLTADGRVKVLDFGLAKAMEPVTASGNLTQSPTISPVISGAMTAANVILGTAGYMSPEQARGQAVDKRADIWAFGVILYEMLVGRRLFVGDTVSDTLAAVLRLDPEWEQLPEQTPPQIRRLLRRCLERDARQRLRDIGDARLALSEVMSGAAEEVAAEVTVAAAPRRPLLAIGVGTALAAAGFALGFLLHPGAPDPPLRRFEIPVSDLTTGLGSGTTLALSPDATRLAFTSQDRLWIRHFDRVEPRVLENTEGAVRPFWSPDGEWIAYGTDERLWKIHADGGEPVALCELESGFSPAAGGAWREDGTIVFCHGDGPLLAVSAQGGDPDTLLPIAEGDDDFHNVAPLPGGGLVFVVHRAKETFDRIDTFVGGKRSTLLFLDGVELTFPVWSPSGHLLFRRSGQNAGIWALPLSSRGEPRGDAFLAVPEGDLPDVAADGTLIHVRGNFSEKAQLVMVDREGHLVDTIGTEQELRPFVRLAPDGTRIVARVWAENPDLWIFDRARGTQTRFTFEESDEQFPAWSPDGKSIFFTRWDDAPGFTLHRKAADGTGAIEDVGPGGIPIVSSDGRFLVYTKQDDADPSSFDIWYRQLGADGRPTGEPILFLDTPHITWNGTVSPDGRFLAYQSDESGRNEIYLKRFPSGDGKWQASVDGGFWPRWNAAGSELFFADGSELLAVSVQTSPDLSLGTPRVLFERETLDNLPNGWPDAFDVTSDGQHFLLAQGVATDSSVRRGLVVVQNWFAEFETRR
jgi:Tol biopolymer transport system component